MGSVKRGNGAQKRRKWRLKMALISKYIIRVLGHPPGGTHRSHLIVRARRHPTRKEKNRAGQAVSDFCPGFLGSDQHPAMVRGFHLQQASNTDLLSTRNSVPGALSTSSSVRSLPPYAVSDATISPFLNCRVAPEMVVAATKGFTTSNSRVNDSCLPSALHCTCQKQEGENNHALGKTARRSHPMTHRDVAPPNRRKASPALMLLDLDGVESGRTEVD